MLEGSNQILIEKSLHFNFKASNNQIEYEAILCGLLLSKDVGARRVVFRTDSRLTVGHLNDDYQIKDQCFLNIIIWSAMP